MQIAQEILRLITMTGWLWKILMISAGNVVAFDNNCLLNDKNLFPPTKNAPQTFLKDCPKWVIETTDAVWNTRTDINGSLEKYFYQDWSSTSSWGHRIHGMDKLKNLVASTLKAFPDLQIHITDVACYGNDIDGYKTVMPDILTGTNTGPSGYGPATGKSVRYSGTAITYVQRVKGQWQYIAEWLLHDEFSLIAQLGFTDLTSIPHPPLDNELHDCLANEPGFGWRAPGEENPAEATKYINQKNVLLFVGPIEEFFGMNLVGVLLLSLTITLVGWILIWMIRWIRKSKLETSARISDHCESQLEYQKM